MSMPSKNHQELDDKNEIKTETCIWNNKRETQIITCQSIKTKSLMLEDDPKYKLFIRLKLPPQANAMAGYKQRQFLRTLLMTMKYDECLIIELNEDVASATCNELKYQEKTPSGIVHNEALDKLFTKIQVCGQRDMFIMQSTDKTSKGSLTFSYFKKLIKTSSIEQFQIDFSEEKLFGCKIEFTADNEDIYTGNYPTVFIQTKNDTITGDQSLSFQDALDNEKLGTKIYEVVKNFYKIKDESKDGFLLRMSLKFMYQKVPSRLKWPKSDIYEVLNVVIQNHRTKYLAELIESCDIKNQVIQLLEELPKWKELKMTDVPLSDWNKSYKGPNKQIIKDGNLMQLLNGVRIQMDSDELVGCMLLFLNALEKKKLRASLFYWTHLDNSIGSALIAHYFLKQMMKKEHDRAIYNKMTQYKDIYQISALKILDQCYKENILSTWLLLVQCIPVWGKESCITIAMKTKNREFIQHKPCTDLNEFVWSNYDGKALQDLEPDHVFNKTTKKTTMLETLDSYFHFPPKIRCRLDLAGYVMFLTAYSILLVSLLQTNTFHCLEAVVMAYMFILFAREMDEVYQQRKEYTFEVYNILDILAISAATVAWILRWVAYFCEKNSPTQSNIMEASRFIFSFDFILFSVRITEYFYENRFLGPILVKVEKMVKIYIPFLLILFIYLMAYSVASESLLYPETPLHPLTMFYIFRKGFWAMMGDYKLDDLEIEEDECTKDVHIFNNNSQLRCPSVSGKHAVPILLAAYTLFVQILMLNLIIALFNYAIDRKEKQNDMIWRYQKFLLSEQYSRCRILLPPFILLFIFLISRVGQPFRSSSEDKEDDTAIKDFESIAKQKIKAKIIDDNFTNERKRKLYLKSKDSITKVDEEKVDGIYERLRNSEKITPLRIHKQIDEVDGMSEKIHTSQESSCSTRLLDDYDKSTFIVDEVDGMNEKIHTSQESSCSIPLLDDYDKEGSNILDHQ